MIHARKTIFLLFILSVFFKTVSWADGIFESKEPNGVLLKDFDNAAEKEDWRIINDSVMGGISQSEVVFSDTGTAIFQGTVSLENNGGFASTRTQPRSYNLAGFTGLAVRIQGDGKDYQLRVWTDDRFDGISYRHHFTTQPDTWVSIRVPFSEFVPVFRGRILEDVSAVSPEQIQQIGFLIADKQAGKFRLEIDWIKAYKLQWNMAD